MECKYYDLKGSLAAAERINRYIMECKLSDLYESPYK